MHYLTGWFIRNPVAANLVMAFILFLGVMTTLGIRIEGFPRIPPESAIISTYYPNATAQQVDNLVTQKIEKALEGLDGVRSISSSSNNGLSQVEVRRSGGTQLSKLVDDIRLKVDGISDLPQSAERPVIETSEFDFPALYINLFGQADPQTLQTLTERLKEELLAQPELSKFNIWGIHDREMRIEVNPFILQRYNLTIAEVVSKVQSSSLDFQSGSLRTTGGNIFLRADDKSVFSTQFAQIPIIENANGSQVRLGEIATILDTFAESDFLFRFNGKPTSGMEVLVGQKENLLHISKVVHSVVEDYKKVLPANLDISVWGDSSNYISDRLALLRTNGVQGLILVCLILSIFLNVRLAFWVAMGIPISVMGAIAVAGSKWVDYSLNDVTTFGLIIALGILVDDAVVVGESVFEERKKHKDPIVGTEKGVAKVAVATVFGVLTTVAAFFPMLLIDNPLGKVLAGFSGIVILALLFSLLESKFILPAHLAAIQIDTKPRYKLSRLWAIVQKVARRGLFGFRDKLYAPVLKASLRHRYAVLILFISAATLGMGMIIQGKIKTVFFPDVPGQIITVNMEMDTRSPFDLTQQNMEWIEHQGQTLNLELQEKFGLDSPPIRTMLLLVSSAQSAQLYAELIPVAERPEVTVNDLVKQWQDRTGALEGTTELEFTGTEALGGGFQLQLNARNQDQLKSASLMLKQFLSEIEGVRNIRDNLTGGQPELDIRIKPEARSLGFTPESLAEQVGYAFGGAEVQKVRRDGSEIKVIVKHEHSARDTIDDLLSARVRSDQGEWIPISTVADIKGSYVSSTVYRKNARQVNTVMASIDRQQVAPEEISQAVFEQLVPELQTRFPGVRVSKGGELEEMGEIRSGMIKALILSAVLIYVLMAIPLKSYWQPFIILAIVPFGFIGAAIGHLIMDLPLSLLSFFGMLALTGVVVNDSLVMMTRYNQAKASGFDTHDALQEAGVGRFQAIFLTTATTVIGLTPLLMETSEQAQYLIPAAVSLAFGELISTVLMLILVPVLIAITEDLGSLFKKNTTKPIALNADSHL